MAKTKDQQASGSCEQAIAEHLKVIEALRSEIPTLEQIASLMSRVLLHGKKVLWCGNGGSAADAEHMAAELVGRFLRERRALPSIALSTNTALLTAIGNDYGYEHLFRRQIEAQCVAGDVVVGISTSGNSKNVRLALEAARAAGAHTVAFTGKNGGAITEFAELTLRIPSTETPRVQEGHTLCGHMLCDMIEKRIVEADNGKAAPTHGSSVRS
jgi:D-sedoheptulose 7-phosphate isomerase